MALWLMRVGDRGQFEERFLSTGRIYLTWEEVRDSPPAALKTADDVKSVLRAHDPEASGRLLGNWAGQIMAFLQNMKVGDLVVSPRKSKSSVAIGEITSDVQYDSNAEVLFRHSRTVKWLNVDVPRTAFDADLLHSLAALLTICQISRDNAEKRVRRLASPGLPLPEAKSSASNTTTAAVTEDTGDFDLEESARDQIAKWIIRKYKGYGLETLVEAILKAQGYMTFHSPKGADKGKDLLAAPGPMGFGHPRICVQVKATDGPVDRPMLDQLIGTMHHFKADQALLVSWGGFTTAVEKESGAHFFTVRLWDQRALINELLQCYSRLDEDLRAEIPLKQIWTLATSDL